MAGPKIMRRAFCVVSQTVSITPQDVVLDVLQELEEKLRYDLNCMETYREYTEAVYS